MQVVGRQHLTAKDMGNETIIAWTDRTFNPWMGCVKIDPGCANCYAETLTKNRMGLDLWGKNARRQVTTPANWRKPIVWDCEAAETGTRLKTFCASLCDVFEDHPTANATRPDLWRLVRSTPNLDWQILTKRADRIRKCLPSDWGDGWPNVWLGVSICEPNGVWRADHLREIPAAVRFVSYEPALGPLADTLDLTGIDWVIYGGESGPGFRGHDPEWPRAMWRACEKADVAFFYKQSPAYRTEMGTTLDGRVIRKFPTPRTLQWHQPVDCLL